MSIVTGEIKFYLSGGTTNTSPSSSLGSARSQNDTNGVINSGLLNNMWADVGNTESSAGSIKYRCIYVRNINVATTWTNAKVWISSLTASSDDEIDIGLGTSAINGIEQSIANDTTAPNTVIFLRPITKGTGLTLGNIPPGEHKALWIRRTLNAGASQHPNNFYVISAEGETV